jgi:protein-L-isoaspartate(D-aspartate) O-methyltransferase
MTRVLLVWPGSVGESGGNFGCPQLVLLASYVMEKTGCTVDIRDLICERALPSFSLDKLFEGDDGEGYDVVGFSVYSSFDWLFCEELARRARLRLPESVIVAGGYHASACPHEVVYDGSPFDVCVVGEGEIPLARIIESVQGGSPIRHQIMGSEPIEELDLLPATNWSLLDRYRGIARNVASQAQLYLSRGCPFDCAFCMERAKRDVRWRAYSVERAVEEVERLHAWLDLEGWTLFVADALFGMKTSWRRAFLEELARRRLPIDKIWLLIRIDLVENDDLALLHEANCAPGFGLESGDPAQLAIIRKAGRLDTYLDRMKEIASWALAHNMPWGANVIVGHPGETPESMARSAAYLRELFSGPSTGFLAVDPFRLYPGSPIDQERPAWEARYGTRFHFPKWWHEGDPAFLAEWVDPSSSLDYLTREKLQHALFTPILQGIESRSAYTGPARDFFLRTIREQVAFTEQRLPTLDRYFAWSQWTGRGAQARAELDAHDDIATITRAARVALLPRIASIAKLDLDSPILAAIAKVPRERFAPLDGLLASTHDAPIALGSGETATVSAMHAYALTFALAGVREGARVLDLGSGSGYGTALLAELVGPSGFVQGVEIDPVLAASSQEAFKSYSDIISLIYGSALDAAHWRGDYEIVVVGFAMDAVPYALASQLAEGCVLVAPVVRAAGEQQLMRMVAGTPPTLEWHNHVRYVGALQQAPEVTRAPTAKASPVHLPVLKRA